MGRVEFEIEAIAASQIYLFERQLHKFSHPIDKVDFWIVNILASQNSHVFQLVHKSFHQKDRMGSEISTISTLHTSLKIASDILHTCMSLYAMDKEGSGIAAAVSLLYRPSSQPCHKLARPMDRVDFELEAIALSLYHCS